MTEQELKRLKRQAYDGSINLDNLPAPEYRYCHRIRRLYKRYKFDKNMPKDFAERMKRCRLLLMPLSPMQKSLMLLIRKSESARHLIAYCKLRNAG